MANQNINDFVSFIWNYYRSNGRDFPWRKTRDPYAIFISEIMLQQTQTHRVLPKYEQWLAEFPHFESLAQAPLRDVLSVWQGLGYNRRGMYIQKTAQRIVAEHHGLLPADPAILVTLPGIGKNTAGSICAFAFNMPVIFIETNIRAVYLHSFFKEKEDVHDKDLVPLITQTIDTTNPREWYYALMDYGVFLKKQYKNPCRKSLHHAKQSQFEGSHRQVRGAILRALDKYGELDVESLAVHTQKDVIRLEKALNELIREGFLKKRTSLFSIQ